MNGESISLSTNERQTIDSFVDQMLDAGKTSKCDNFREAYTLGKGAEQAVVNFLNEVHHIGASVDYDVYEGSDTSDIVPYNAEVKVMPAYGNWVAIPERNASRIDDDEPIIIVKHHSDSRYEVVGWCFKNALSLIEQGEKPFTQKADNLCMHVRHLDEDWKTLCEEMGADPQSRFDFSSSS